MAKRVDTTQKLYLVHTLFGSNKLILAQSDYDLYGMLASMLVKGIDIQSVSEIALDGTHPIVAFRTNSMFKSIYAQWSQGTSTQILAQIVPEGYKVYRAKIYCNSTQHILARDKQDLFAYLMPYVKKGHALTSVIEIQPDGKTPKVAVLTHPDFKAMYKMG